jgi:hypothetical protein
MKQVIKNISVTIIKITIIIINLAAYGCNTGVSEAVTACVIEMNDREVAQFNGLKGADQRAIYTACARAIKAGKPLMNRAQMEEARRAD